jgi:hypothetical protein
MINKLLLIYDNEDKRQGEYFSALHQNMIEKLDCLSHTSIHSLNTEQCLSNPIADYLPDLNVNSIIFVAYTHGNEDEILVSEQSYVNTQNAYFFAKSLFYACSCLAAKKLGNHLISQNCSVFVGYDATIRTAIPETEPIFQECENAFLVNFLTTSNTIQESLTFMYKKYTEMIRSLSEDYDAFSAGILEANLSAFQILCPDENLGLTKMDFKI